MFRQIFHVPSAGLMALVFSILILSLDAAPSQAGTLSSSGLTSILANTRTGTILVAEGNRRPRTQATSPEVQEGNRRPRKARPAPVKRRASPAKKPRNTERRRVRSRDSAGQRNGARRDRVRKNSRKARNRDRRRHRDHRRHRGSGFGFSGFYDGPFPNDRYYDGYDPYYDEPVRRKITCARARKVVSRRGYRRVRAYDCRGKVYGFYARKGKRRFKVRISAYTSRILAVNRVRSSRR